MPVEVEVEQDRRGERARREHDVLEERQPEHTPGRLVSRCPGLAKSPVVDGEAARSAGCSEDPEAGDNRGDARRKVELLAVIDTRHIAHRQYVASVGNELAREADEQPRPGVPLDDEARHVRPAGVGGKAHRHCDRCTRREQHDHERLLFEAEIHLAKPLADPPNCVGHETSVEQPPAPTSVRGVRILIVGGAGMLGRKLAALLAREGCLGGEPISQLSLVDVVQPDLDLHADFDVAAGLADLAEDGVAADLIAGRPDLIFHLAAVLSGEAEADLEKGYRVNLDGTRFLLDAVRADRLGLPAARSSSRRRSRCSGRRSLT